MSTVTETITRPRDATVVTHRMEIPSDYAIHRTDGLDTSQPIVPNISKAPTSGSGPELNHDGRINPQLCPHPRVEGVVNPDWWPRNWRRIPDYAPVNRNLDIDERPLGGSPRVTRMIFIVINGCALISVSVTSL